MKSINLNFDLVTICIILILSILNAVPALSAQIIFLPELSLSEKYSDNIYLTPENKEEDYISNAGLNLSLQALGRTAGMVLRLNPTYNSFANNSDLDYWRYAAYLNVYNDFSRSTRIELTDNFLETEDPLDETEAAADAVSPQETGIQADRTRRGRARYRVNNAQIRLRKQFGENDSFALGLSHSLLEDIDVIPGVPVSDYTIYQPFVGIDYRFTPKWSVEFNAYYSNRQYEDEDRPDREEYHGDLRILRAFGNHLSGVLGYRHTYLNYIEESYDDFQVYNPTLGISYRFQESANIYLSGGYLYEEVPNNPDTNIESWNIHSEIFKRWSYQKGYVTLTGSSGYALSDRGTENLDLNIYYEGRTELGYSFTPYFSMNVTGSYRNDEYPNETPKRVDDIVRAGLGFSYQVVRWIFLSLRYNYTDFQSTYEYDEYRENSVILSITMRPSTGYRLN